MTIREKLESCTSDCYCGSACFASLLPLCALLPEGERDSARALLLKMVDLDGKVFTTLRKDPLLGQSLLEEAKKGYRQVLRLLEKVRLSDAFLCRQVELDKAFLKDLLSTMEVEG